MNIDVNHACICITEMRNEGYVKRRYVGYSKKEAMAEFREEFPEED